MKQVKLSEEDIKIINDICKETPTTRYLIRQNLEEIYECIDILQENIIYLTPTQLEPLEEDHKERILEEEFSYENI